MGRETVSGENSVLTTHRFKKSGRSIRLALRSVSTCFDILRLMISASAQSSFLERQKKFGILFRTFHVDLHVKLHRFFVKRAIAQTSLLKYLQTLSKFQKFSR